MKAPLDDLLNEDIWNCANVTTKNRKQQDSTDFRANVTTKNRKQDSTDFRANVTTNNRKQESIDFRAVPDMVIDSGGSTWWSMFGSVDTASGGSAGPVVPLQLEKFDMFEQLHAEAVGYLKDTVGASVDVLFRPSSPNMIWSISQ
jgi:hypothetical protein